MDPKKSKIQKAQGTVNVTISSLVWSIDGLTHCLLVLDLDKRHLIHSEISSKL